MVYRLKSVTAQSKPAVTTTIGDWEGRGCYKDNSLTKLIPNYLGVVKSFDECRLLAV
jgi:hypothetical protein